MFLSSIGLPDTPMPNESGQDCESLATGTPPRLRAGCDMDRSNLSVLGVRHYLSGVPPQRYAYADSMRRQPLPPVKRPLQPASMGRAARSCRIGTHTRGAGRAWSHSNSVHCRAVALVSICVTALADRAVVGTALQVPQLITDPGSRPEGRQPTLPEPSSIERGQLGQGRCRFAACPSFPLCSGSLLEHLARQPRSSLARRAWSSSR